MSSDFPSHPALVEGRAAVITGGANGIGLAVAKRLAAQGMKVAVADRDEEQLAQAREELGEAAQGQAQIEARACDVGDAAQLHELAAWVGEAWGPVAFLMNNAGMGLRAGKSWENPEQWRKLLEVNLWGVLHGVQAFVPGMLAGGEPGLIVNTGSKQGLTRPPGNPAYNLSKAGVIAFTESLAHELRQEEGCQLSAHLLLPGFTYTGMVARFLPQRPPGAWLPEQVADFLLQGLGRGDFYVLCPDNDVDRPTDERRAQWHADDLIRNRPALSRWHPDFAEDFAAFVERGE